MSRSPLSRAIIPFVVLGCAVAPSAALAWGQLGHEVVGEIAERLVADDPATKQLLTRVLGVEPLAISATFPDDVRDDARFKPFVPFHFVNFADDGSIANPRNARALLQEIPAILADPKAPRAGKLLALRYLIHVTGDVHQPLHVAGDADLGGNACKVRTQPDPARAATTANFHSVWDTALVEYAARKLAPAGKQGGFITYNDFATNLLAAQPDLAKAAVTVNVAAWIRETHDLALNAAYPDRLPPAQRAYCQRGGTGAALPLLDHAYFETSSELVERQLVRAGARLAALLRSSLAATAGSPVDGAPEAGEAEILQGLFP